MPDSKPPGTEPKRASLKKLYEAGKKRGKLKAMLGTKGTAATTSQGPTSGTSTPPSSGWGQQPPAQPGQG
jgi:hypothetical protein